MEDEKFHHARTTSEHQSLVHYRVTALQTMDSSKLRDRTTIRLSNRHINCQHSSLRLCVNCFGIFGIPFLADRTNGRAIATLLRLSSVCL